LAVDAGWLDPGAFAGVEGIIENEEIAEDEATRAVTGADTVQDTENQTPPSGATDAVTARVMS